MSAPFKKCLTVCRQRLELDVLDGGAAAVVVLRGAFPRGLPFLREVVKLAQIQRAEGLALRAAGADRIQRAADVVNVDADAGECGFIAAPFRPERGGLSGELRGGGFQPFYLGGHADVPPFGKFDLTIV